MQSRPTRDPGLALMIQLPFWPADSSSHNLPLNIVLRTTRQAVLPLVLLDVVLFQPLTVMSGRKPAGVRCLSLNPYRIVGSRPSDFDEMPETVYTSPCYLSSHRIPWVQAFVPELEFQPTTQSSID
ncbi:hypothetical protein CHU98_g8751 [Xylaria longipes]|nr:hypothetical protein CHU98_g8751 [Xylaria longipes]